MHPYDYYANRIFPLQHSLEVECFKLEKGASESLYCKLNNDSNV